MHFTALSTEEAAVGGNVSANATAVTASIEVDPIATAPTLTTSATTIDETGSSTSHLQVTVTNAADVFESGDSVSVTISGLPSGTVLTQGGTAITADGSGNFTVTATAQTGLDNIQVTPPSEFEGTINYTLSATTTDTATGPSGQLSNTSSPATVLAGTIEVDPIATAPTLTTSATTIDETGSSTSHLQVTVTNAADVFESGDSASVTISGLPSGTVLTQGGTAITADGSGNFTVTATAQTGLDNIQVTPPSEFEGTINYTLSATTTDTATGPSGQLSNTSSPATVLAGTIEVDPIATAPTLTTSATTIDETGSSTSHLQVTVTNAADVFESGDSVSVTISGLPSGTVLTQGGTAITADGSGNFTVTATAQTGLDNIQVTPPSEFEGTINYTLSATTTDTATGPSGQLSNTSSPATVLAGTIEVDPIATAPTLTTSATTIDETGSSTSHLQVTVTNAADVFESGDSVSVTISGLPSGTVLTQGGTAITADGSGNFTVTATAQTGLDNIQVTPPSEFEGTINYTLSATTTDTATGPSGQLSNTSSPATVLAGTIEVDPIATAPTLTTSATTIDETGSSTSHLQVTVTNAADVFESGDSASVTISGLPSGTVLTQGGTAITADGSGNFTVTATAQTGLDNIQATPPSEFEGTINYTLSATTTDTATGPSGQLSNTSSPATVLAGTIEVDPIATAPT